MIKRIKKKFLEKRYIFTFLYPFLKECKSFLILLIAETFLIAIISIPIPVINGVCIDVIVQKSSFNRVVSLLVILFILYFAKSILSYVARTGFSKAGIILVRNLKYELVNKITRLPLEYITENGDGYLFARISESDSIKKIISTNTVSVLVSIIEFFFSMVAIFIVNYKLAMCTCICLTLLFVCSRIFLIKIKIRTSELLEENAHTSNLLMDIIGENKLIKIICLFDRQLSLVKKQLEHLKRKQYQLAKKNDQYIETIQMANWLHGVIILAISGYLIFKGEMSIGNYTTYIGYSSKLFGNIMSFSTFSVLLNSIQLSVERLQSFFMVGDEESGVKKISNIYNIEFNNISFAYKGNDIILENFSLQLNKNEPKILCGNNGTGKSTLVNLLLGLYQVKEGNIVYSATTDQGFRQN